MRVLAAAAILLTIACVDHQTGNRQTQPPNILLIVSDDVGYADIGIYGSQDIRTPNIDRVAREAIRFTNAYVSGPYCSPTRAGLMTGRYPQRFGYEFNPDGSPDYGLPLAETTMADRLKGAGYRTALFGKWHLGSAARLHPLRRGFEEFYGFLGGDHSYLNVAHIDVGTHLPDPLLGPMQYTYDFVLKDGKLTGKIKSSMFGDAEVLDGKVDGDTVSFVQIMDSSIRVEYSGKIVSADEIDFTRQVGEFGTEDLVAKRVKA